MDISRVGNDTDSGDCTSSLWFLRDIKKNIRRHMPAAADRILSGRFKYVQYAYKHTEYPLSFFYRPSDDVAPSPGNFSTPPTRDWPLAICDAVTVDQNLDVEPCDIISDVIADADSHEENFQVYHRPRHFWYYLGAQTASEVLLFRQYDSELGYASGNPHAAFCHPRARPDERPRESIEVQILPGPKPLGHDSEITELPGDNIVDVVRFLKGLRFRSTLNLGPD
ncbi:hypothetical protein B0T22DRAFT_438737 [Podospora appendiculata]|uniref:Uncharacterized protein n=1 Tax=Podospora appendiculata TaxID=314037 RepID=A0AAE0XM24_9PEZI|nr:hypothetical protein B0T22DRAFT_438737 [Podospora appendiculata]